MPHSRCQIPHSRRLWGVFLGLGMIINWHTRQFIIIITWQKWLIRQLFYGVCQAILTVITEMTNIITFLFFLSMSKIFLVVWFVWFVWFVLRFCSMFLHPHRYHTFFYFKNSSKYIYKKYNNILYIQSKKKCDLCDVFYIITLLLFDRAWEGRGRGSKGRKGGARGDLVVKPRPYNAIRAFGRYVGIGWSGGD